MARLVVRRRSAASSTVSRTGNVVRRDSCGLSRPRSARGNPSPLVSLALMMCLRLQALARRRAIDRVSSYEPPRNDSENTEPTLRLLVGASRRQRPYGRLRHGSARSVADAAWQRTAVDPHSVRGVSGRWRATQRKGGREFKNSVADQDDKNRIAPAGF